MRDPGLTAEDLPDEKGAYAVVLRLGRPRRLAIPTLDHPRLSAGRYLYVGSAWGPGGIRARLGRHLRGGAKRHWHVDHLIAAGRIERVFAWPGARECDVVAEALAAGARVPVPGFGSSDCRRCPAHLVTVEDALVRFLQNRDSRASWEEGPRT